MSNHLSNLNHRFCKRINYCLFGLNNETVKHEKLIALDQINFSHLIQTHQLDENEVKEIILNDQKNKEVV